MNIASTLRNTILDNASATLDSQIKPVLEETLLSKPDSQVDRFFANFKADTTANMMDVVGSVHSNAQARIATAKAATNKAVAHAQLSNATSDIQWCISTISGYLDDETLSGQIQSMLSDLNSTQGNIASALRASSNKLAFTPAPLFNGQTNQTDKH